MWIGGQLASARASLGARRVFLAFAFPFLSDGQKGFFSTFGILRRAFFVSSTAVAAMNAPPPTSAPQANPTETLIEEFLFLREEGGMSVR